MSGTNAQSFAATANVVSTAIEWVHTTEHNGSIAIRTTDPNIHGWLSPLSESIRPIIFSIACLAVARGKQIKVRFRSFDGNFFQGAEVIDIV